MSYLAGIDIGGSLCPPGTLDFAVPRGAFPTARYDLHKLRRDIARKEIDRGPASVWRYWMLLPADHPAGAVTLGEGRTPLLPLPALGCRHLWIKDEGRNPSGSFKDRAASVALTRYRELGVATVALNSTGNASAAWALYAARAGIRCISFLPVDGQASTRKQCGLAGGEVRFVPEWAGVGRLVSDECAARGWLNVSALKEPYRIEGKKTLAFEIAEQMDWRLPDTLVFPTGGGLSVLAMYKGFQELRELGWITDPDPQLVITQYAGCAPIARAFAEEREDCEPWGSIDILPGGMKSPNPLAGAAVLALLRRTGGHAVSVTNDEVLAAQAEICRAEGLFVCPEAATTLVGVRNAIETRAVGENARIVLVGTASGSKSLSLVPDPLPRAAQ
jgi:threonine synthase